MISTTVRNGILVGAAVALIQSLLSTLALKWALKRIFFMWVWVGGILARVAVLIVTAVVVSGQKQLDLMATLLSLVVATMVFLIIESRIFLTE